MAQQSQVDFELHRKSSNDPFSFKTDGFDKLNPFQYIQISKGFMLG